MISGDLQLREQLRKCIVVEHPPHGEEDEIGVRASASNARQVGVIARLAQDRESRRRKRDGVCFALLHSQGRHAPCGLREIDLRPSRPAGLVRAHGREDEKLEKQSRANPGIRRAHGRQSRRNLRVRQSAVVLDLCRNVGRHGIERRTTRIVLPIPLANSPGRHGSDLVANCGHRRRSPLSNRLQDGGHMVRFDIAHTESAQLGINIEGRVAAGSYPPAAPTDPGVPNSTILCCRQHRMVYVANLTMWRSRPEGRVFAVLGGDFTT